MHSNKESLDMNIYEVREREREIRRWRLALFLSCFEHVWASGKKMSKQQEYVRVVISTCGE